MGQEPKASRLAPGNDNLSPASQDRGPGADGPEPGGFFADFVMAVRFYSLLPMGKAAHEAPEINRIARAAPFASLAIAALPALVLIGLKLLGLPDLLTALFAVAAGAIVTGAMAEDAIGDSMDGLGGRTPERRLEILKDSRIGAYGVLGIALFVGMKASALAHLLATGSVWAALLLIAAQVVARSGALWLIHALPAARRDGASATAGALKRLPMLIGFGFAGLIVMVLATPLVGPFGVGLALVLAVPTCVLWTQLWRRLIGGQTGDLIGGLQAVLEIVVLTAFILAIGGPR